MRDRYPWLDIRRKWEASPEHLTLSAFAKQVGIDKATISRRMRKEHWCRQPSGESRPAPPQWPTLIDHMADKPGRQPDLTTDDGTDYDIIEITAAEESLTVYRDLYRDLESQHRTEVGDIDRLREAAMRVAHAALESGDPDQLRAAREASTMLNTMTKALDAKQKIETRTLHWPR